MRRNICLLLIFTAGVMYGLFSLRYLPTFFFEETRALGEKINVAQHPLFYSFHYYFFPLTNKIAFFTHVIGGAFMLFLGPLIFFAFSRNWKMKKILVRLYFAFSFPPIFFPILFVAKDEGMATPSYYVIMAIIFLWVFLLYKSIVYYKKNMTSLFTTYLFYHYSISVGAAFWRLLGFILNKYYNLSLIRDQITMNSINLEHLMNISHGIYDNTWALTLIITILISKYISNFHVMHFTKDKHSILLKQSKE